MNQRPGSSVVEHAQASPGNPGYEGQDGGSTPSGALSPSDRTKLGQCINCLRDAREIIARRLAQVQSILESIGGDPPSA